jgi:hypothetical protein
MIWSRVDPDPQKWELRIGWLAAAEQGVMYDQVEQGSIFGLKQSEAEFTYY